MILNNISVEKKLFAGFIFSILLIAVLSFYLYQSKLTLHRQTLLIKTNNELRIHVNNLLASLNKLEVDRKRYLLTNGQGDSLEYLKYLTDFHSEFQKFRTFIKKEKLSGLYLDSLEKNTSRDLAKLTHNYRLSFRLEQSTSDILKNEEALFNKFNDYLNQINDEYEQKNLEGFAVYQENLDDNLFHYFILLIAFMLLLSAYFIIIMHDTKKRKILSNELEESRNELDTIINTVPALIFVKNKERQFTHVNKFFLDFFKTTKEKLLFRGKSVGRNKNEEWLSEEEDEAVLSNKMPIYNIEREIKLREGTVYWLNVNKAPLLNHEGNVTGLVGVMNDITQLIDFQNSLIEARRELEELNRQKNKFFSIIAHDLKSPFSGLLGISEFMVSDYDELTDAEKREFLINMNNAVKSIWELLSNLLTWSRIQFERIDFTPEPFNLQPVIRSVFKSLRISADNKNITLETDCPDDVQVYADINMIETVIRNLVNNSIKFTKPGGYVAVNAKNCVDGVLIAIEDSGIGMSKDIAENLFRVDIQVTSKGTADEKGTGLGLSICDEFVRKHKSTLKVESEINKGTTISFMLFNSLR